MIGLVEFCNRWRALIASAIIAAAAFCTLVAGTIGTDTVAEPSSVGRAGATHTKVRRVYQATAQQNSARLLRRQVCRHRRRDIVGVASSPALRRFLSSIQGPSTPSLHLAALGPGAVGLGLGNRPAAGPHLKLRISHSLKTLRSESPTSPSPDVFWRAFA
jgi:hypothetical protein